MNEIQSDLKNLLEKDGWEMFQIGKGNMLIMKKQITSSVIYISIKEDGSVHFNRRK